MLRAMYSGVSGLRSYQTMMDVVGNNISNSNTAGFKSSQTVFQDRLSQVLQGAGQPAGGGGTNPASVGLGVRLASTPTSFVQGGLQVTGRNTDLSIQGDGFFAVNFGGETLYTRAGSFSFDSGGLLVNPQGAIVQGWLADATGAIDSTLPVEDLRMPLGQVIDPVETDSMRLGGNLPADTATAGQISSSFTVYDQQGTEYRITLTFEKTANPDEWTVTATQDGAAITLDDGGGAAASITFDFDNTTGLSNLPTFDIIPVAGVWDGDGIIVDMGTAADPDAVTQFAGANSFSALSQDGAAVGFLQSFSISQEGLISGVFSNGKTQSLGQIALVNFNNPAGLERADGSTWRVSVNSGLPQTGVPGTGGRGLLAGGTLEMSNVDLAQEFSNLIIAQRGFQANSRIISTSDELLADLVNLKR